jgi:predicted O-linked N-acetylglucosamine transferase (SPINDLY family)
MEEAFRLTGAIKKDAHARKKYPGTSAYEKIEERINKKLVQLTSQGDNAAACELAAGLVNERPDNPHVWHFESQVFSHQGRYGEALRDLAKALSIESTQWTFYYDFAIQLWRLRHPWFAEKIVRYCLRFNSKSTKLWSLFCSLNKDSGKLDLAEKCARKVLAIDPMHTATLTNLATVLSMRSGLDDAIPWLRKACESAPHEFLYFTNYLFGLLHSPTVSAEYVFAEHQRYGRMVTRWAKQQGGVFKLENDKDPLRRLRVGFVSGDLGLHPVTNFIRPIWDALNTEQFALYAYETNNRNDPVTHQLRKKTDIWCEAKNLSPLELAKRIHHDGIDILIDLSGHTDHNRLPAFGLKPAPVSMSFIGYPGTTGLTEMDYYLLHDKVARPGELDSQYTEALIYLPFNQQFSLFHDAPEVTPTPAISNKIFTFGSFNRVSKINDAVLACWAEVLRRCENSRMLIGSLNDETIELYIARFAALGIDSSRLIMRKRKTMPEYLQMHAEVDLLLDTFPYPGGTTANYALQMGVPTLTLAGETTVMRQGAGNMRQFGLDEFVVTSQEEYIARAVDITRDVQALNAIRLTLRERIYRQSSKDGNPAVYLEAALREAWRRYCRGDAVTSFSAEKYIAG